MFRPLLRSAILAAFPILALLAAEPVLSAPGVLHFTWNGCGSVLNIPAVPGQSSGLHFVAYVTGQSDPTESYEVWILYGTPQNAVPDAWRFDPVGCQGSSQVTVEHIPPPPLAATCPAFQDAGGPHNSFFITDVDFSPPTLPYPTTVMRVALAVVYPAGNVPDPGKSYFLMGVNFDETFGVNGPGDPSVPTCGGLENVMCFKYLKANYIINDGTMAEVAFGPSALFNPTVNDANNSSCNSVVPARPATWGEIKSQYRN